MTFEVHGMDSAKLRSQIKRHEALRLKPYLDSDPNTYYRKAIINTPNEGVLTVGYGTNIEQIDEAEAELLFEYRLRNTIENVKHLFLGWPYFSDARKRALIGMAYNMGVGGLAEFKRMRSAIAHHDWERAADEALDSLWARQVGRRATELAGMLREG